MLSKCANPDCSASFHYLGEGKLYEIRYEAESVADANLPRKLAAGRSERFWLCDSCATSMTLGVDSSRKIVLLPIAKPPQADVQVRRAIA